MHSWMSPNTNSGEIRILPPLMGDTQDFILMSHYFAVAIVTGSFWSSSVDDIETSIGYDMPTHHHLPPPGLLCKLCQDNPIL